ncbi:integrase domain-containing protein [Sodalis endosymbiont of Spalangia cameroni]|uniref:integrase domain-containing protein n=1 Tax=Sodalis praecaptivus TaxID=1239307 RepID=UPI0031F8F7C1
MPRIIEPLQDTKIRNAKATTKDYVLYDGGGVELLVTSRGAKLWRYRYYHPVTKKRTMMGLGPYPAVSLAEVRRFREKAKAQLRAGTDPLTHQRDQQAAEKEIHGNTLYKVAEDWFTVKKSTISRDYAHDIWRSLEIDIFPSLGDRPIAALKATMLVNALRPVANRGRLDTVRRLAQRLNEIMVYAINSGVLEANPASGIAKAFEKPQKKNMPSIPPSQLPGLMQALYLARMELPTRLLIEWLLLTAVRPGEAAKARWQDIDREQEVWTIPAESMKMKRPHTVPLSRQALDVLNALQTISGHREFLFPNRYDPTKHMHSETVSQVLRRIGYKNLLVAHGMRSLVSTAMNDHGFNPDVIEAVLAHGEKNAVRAAYNRTTYLEQRKELMQWWGDFVSAAAKGSLSAAESLKSLHVKGMTDV